MVVAIRRRSPGDARLALGADGSLPLPVDPKLREGIAGLLPGLPAWVAPDRSEELDGVIVSACDQAIRRGVAGVDQVLAREEVAGGQAVLNRGGGLVVLVGCRGRGHVGDEVRGVVVAGLGEVG